MLTAQFFAEMQKYAFAAPVHNIPYIESIGIFSKILNVPMVGVFEPSFHYSIPEFRKLMVFHGNGMKSSESKVPFMAHTDILQQWRISYLVQAI